MPRRFVSVCALVAILLPLCALAWTTQGAFQSVARDQAAPPPGDFPPEIVSFVPLAGNPVFAGEGPDHWDAKIRERGWIMRDAGQYHLWYTGYDGTREGIKQLGYATSPDGRHWQRHADNPLVPGHWIEDMMVVEHAGTYYMFAEGRADHAQLLTSKDRVHWQREGTLDIRDTHHQPLSAGPFGTPTAWLEGGVWYLFYERMDAGVWLATSRDLKVWTNVQDQPVLVPGPSDYDATMIALNQIVKHRGIYYAFYHGSGDRQAPRTWNTDVARSRDLVHWEKYPGNPIVGNNKSSGIVVPDGERYRLYTLHEQVDEYESAGKR